MNWRDVKKKPALILITGACVVALLALVCGGPFSDEEIMAELSEMRAELDELRQVRHDLAAMEKEVAAVRRLVQGDERGDAPVRAVSYLPNGSELDDPFVGPENSDVLVMAFIDYQCRPCRSYAEESFPRLKREFFDTGVAKYLLRDFPLVSHRNARRAAEMAHCAGEQGRYWELHDAMFAHQSAVDQDDLSNLLSFVANLDRKRLDHCMAKRRYEREMDQDLADGTALGAKGAPGFFIGRKVAEEKFDGVFVRGAQPFAVLREQLVKQIALREQDKNTPRPAEQNSSQKGDD